MTASACGDSEDSKAEDTKGDDETSDGGGGGITIDDAGDNGGNNGNTNSAAECTGQGQQCMCDDGAMGFQTCSNGMLGECTCSIDLSDAGLPPPSDCTDGAMCQSTMGFIKGAQGFCSPANDGGAPAFPPSCVTKDDCAAEGLPAAGCVTIMIPSFPPQQLCVQPCIPAQ